jgi:hypothetical protein
MTGHINILYSSESPQYKTTASIGIGSSGLPISLIISKTSSDSDAGIKAIATTQVLTGLPVTGHLQITSPGLYKKNNINNASCYRIATSPTIQSKTSLSCEISIGATVNLTTNLTIETSHTPPSLTHLSPYLKVEFL